MPQGLTMRQETYRFALDEASQELHGIVAQFEALRSRKEQIEKVVEALRPFIGLSIPKPRPSRNDERVAAIEFVAPVIEQPSPEPVRNSPSCRSRDPAWRLQPLEPVPVECRAGTGSRNRCVSTRMKLRRSRLPIFGNPLRIPFNAASTMPSGDGSRDRKVFCRPSNLRRRDQYSGPQQ